MRPRYLDWSGNRPMKMQDSLELRADWSRGRAALFNLAFSQGSGRILNFAVNAHLSEITDVIILWNL